MASPQEPAVHVDLLGWILSVERGAVLLACASMAGLIALADYLKPELSFGILYSLPLAIAAVHLSRLEVGLCAIGAAFLRELLGPEPWKDGSANLAMGIIAFAGLGLLVTEMVQSRRDQMESIRKLQEESALRERAEQGARAIIESSPAAIITVSPDGHMEMANQAATRLLALTPGAGRGQPIMDYFPVIGELIRSKRLFHLAGTMLEGNGRRSDGENFFAQIWLSSYETSAGTQIAAVVADASDQLRDREELGLRQLLLSSRIIAAAVSHEIRNMAAAASAMHLNVGKGLGIDESDDFRALGELIEGMRRLSTAEVPTSAEQVLTGVDINSLLRELNIIIQAEAQDAGIELAWEVVEGLSQVRADRSGLLQVLLNLSHNAIRELTGQLNAKISVAAYELGDSVLVRFGDNGAGIAHPESLFQPFQTGATATGLGLCISRAIIRTFGGELRYVHRQNEGCFLIELPAIASRRASNA